jgi:hypothetical protein
LHAILFSALFNSENTTILCTTYLLYFYFGLYCLYTIVHEKHLGGVGDTKLFHFAFAGCLKRIEDRTTFSPRV